MFIPDRKLIQLFEKISHAFQRLTGKDNFWLGWSVFWLQVALNNLFIYNSVKKFGIDAILISFFLLNAMNIVEFWFNKFVLLICGQKTAMKSRTRNSIEASPIVIGMRCSAVIWSCIELCRGQFRTFEVDFAFMTTWYFFSCTSLPPGESKISQFLKSASAFLSGLGKQPLPQGT